MTPRASRFLRWGGRELTRIQPADGMYSWAQEILQGQVLSILRPARSNERLAGASPGKATPKS